MNGQINNGIPYEELKHLVIDSLRGTDTTQFLSLCASVETLAIERGFMADPKAGGVTYIIGESSEKTKLKSDVRQIIWDLIIERVLTIGTNLEHTWPWLSVTDYGRKVLGQSGPIPNDPSGYIARVKKAIPRLDSIVETYLMESIRTYNINQLLSSTITLGCASERALLLLVEAFKESFNTVEKKAAFSKKVDGKFIKTQFEELDRVIRLPLPKELSGDYTTVLTGVFELIRRNRNAAGHPSGESVDKDTLFANLQVFIPYCLYIYSLIDYFNNNQHD